MRSKLWLFLFLSVALVAALSCSNDSTAPNTPAATSTGLIEGEIGDADFAITIRAAGDAEGPFTLRGFNLHYVDSLTALVVDLTVTNDGETAHPEPIRLTFVKLLPAGVTVLNSDNGIDGEGAAIPFAFDNDDSLWTAGETSLPRTVEFGVAKGTSVGFAARLDVGGPVNGGGTISGRVWNDTNEDGVIDADEAGIAGAIVALSDAGDDSVATSAEATTDEEGFYAFDGLGAGVYRVSKMAADSVVSTTPSEITVLLTEVDGVVSDFTEANFGCLTSGDGGGPTPIPVGAYVEVTGEFLTDPNRIEAEAVNLRSCSVQSQALNGHHDGDDDDDDDDNNGGGGGGGGGGADCFAGILRGPVTAVDTANNRFAVMGTLVNTTKALFPEGLKTGDRVDVRVFVIGENLFGYSIKSWHHDAEQVRGRVDEVVVDNGVLKIRVLNILVTITPEVNPHRV